MNELFAIISRPKRFKWEADVRNDDIAKIVEIDGGNDQPLAPQEVADPFAPVDPTNQDTVSYPTSTGLRDRADNTDLH